jgi:hypothetical protein
MAVASRMRIPWNEKNESIYALDDFVKKVGIPEVLCDNDWTMEGWSEWKRWIKKYSIEPKYTEPYSPFQNKAELDIREHKRMIKRYQDNTRSPQRLWNYLVNLCANIRKSFIAGIHPDLQGHSAFEHVHGWTPDISNHVMHSWFEVVSYQGNDNERKLARWLGPAEDYGGGDAAFLLPKSVKPIVRRTSWCLTPNERLDRRDEIRQLLNSINENIGDNRTNEEVVEALGDQQFPMFDIFGDDNDADINMDNPLSRSEADDYAPEAFDNYLTAEVIADRGRELLRGTVKCRKRDNDGMPIGTANPNPLLDTREYLLCSEG